MKNSRITMTVLIISVLLLSAVPMAISALPADPEPMGESRGTHTESGDETATFADATKPGSHSHLQSGDIYFGNVNRVDDKTDYFAIDAVQQQVVNVHMYIEGYIDQSGEYDYWEPPNVPPFPPPAEQRTAIFGIYMYTGLSSEELQVPIDGAYNYWFTRHYVLNICAPKPGSNTYYVNVSLDWFMTPNNYTWKYSLEVDISPVPKIDPGEVVRDTIQTTTRDIHWYKIEAKFEEAVNGSFRITNFNEDEEEERNIDIWIFPDDLGGWPFSYPWDWSAAPNEPVEPINILSTYDGEFFIKLRAMNHTSSLPCSYRLQMFTNPIPEFPETGIQGEYFDRHHDDTHWYKFEMKANQPHPEKPGKWNEVFYFNMSERGDTDDLPDFDLYLFGRMPGSRWLDLLDSSFRNDHATFFDIERDPNKNTEHVKAAAFYNGTYYLEVNAWNNTGYYDVVMRTKDSPDSDIYPTPKMVSSDENNLPEEAETARAGVYPSHIHQALDHYDWYKVEATSRLKVQLDTFKGVDLFNVSIYRYDNVRDKYVLLKGGWNTWYNHTDQSDHISNLVTVNIPDLSAVGGAGTYYVSVLAAVAAQMATDEVTGNPFIYKTDSDAKADYELRFWVDDAPPYNGPPMWDEIPDLVIDEDTSILAHMDLDDYCRDVDVGDENLRFKAAITFGKLKYIELDGKRSGTHEIGFEAFPDFHGKVVVKITAIDNKYLQNSTTWTIFFNAENDPPRPTYDNKDPDKIYVFKMPEDSVRTLDLSNLVVEVDKDDEFNISFEPSEYIDIELDEEDMVAKVTGAPDWFGETTVTFIAKDSKDATTELPVKFVVENVEDPPSLLKPIGERVILEDSFDTISMTEHFVEPDGDDLFYTLSSNLNIAYEVDPETGIMTLTPDPDWFGFREIWLTATDSTGRVTQTKFFFIVDPVNDPPVINSVSPPTLDHEMNEDTSQSFVVLNVTDPEFSILIYQWYVDNKLVGPSNFYNYRPTHDDQGSHELKVVVIDEEGASDEEVWTIFVKDVPRPPEGGIASPANNAKFSTSDKISFVALFYDLDGDPITYQWFLDDKAQSTEYSFEKSLGSGSHQVKLVVQSGEFTITKYANITVEEAESPGFEAPLVITGLAVTFLAAAVWRRRMMR